MPATRITVLLSPFLVLSTHFLAEECDGQSASTLSAQLFPTTSIYQFPATVAYYPSQYQTIIYSPAWQWTGVTYAAPYCTTQPIWPSQITTCCSPIYGPAAHSPHQQRRPEENGDSSAGASDLNGVGDLNGKRRDSEAPRKNSPDSLLIRLVVNYDGQPQTMTTPAASDEDCDAEIPSPKDGERVTFEIHNESDKLISAVLLVNGMSTLHEQQGDPRTMSKWVLMPNRKYLIEGFYQADNKTFISIEGLSLDLTRERFDQLGGRDAAGLIHLFLFEVQHSSDDSAPDILTLRKTRAERAAAQLAISHYDRSVGRNSHFRQVSDGGLMAWGSTDGKADLRPFNSGNQRLVATFVVRYFSAR